MGAKEPAGMEQGHGLEFTADPAVEIIEIRGRIKEIKGRKVVVESTVLSNGVATARGEVVALQMPEGFGG